MDIARLEQQSYWASFGGDVCLSSHFLSVSSLLHVQKKERKKESFSCMCFPPVFSIFLFHERYILHGVEVDERKKKDTSDLTIHSSLCSPLHNTSRLDWSQIVAVGSIRSEYIRQLLS